MHETKNTNCVHLLHRQHKVWTFSSIKEAAKYYNWLCKFSIADQFKIKMNSRWDIKNGENLYHHYDYILRDDEENVITLNDLYWITKPKHKQYRWQKQAWGRFRHPKTTQERRWACAWDEEEFVPTCRSQRNIKNLPSAWDDYISGVQKSWKWQSKRKHQWK